MTQWPTKPARLDYATKHAQNPPPPISAEIQKRMKRWGVISLALLAFGTLVAFSASGGMHEGKRLIIIKGWIVFLAAIALPASWIIPIVLDGFLFYYRRHGKAIALLLLLLPMSVFILALEFSLLMSSKVMYRFQAKDGKTYYSIVRFPLLDSEYGLGTDKTSLGFADSYQIVKTNIFMYEDRNISQPTLNRGMRFGEIVEGDDGRLFVYSSANTLLLFYEPPR